MQLKRRYLRQISWLCVVGGAILLVLVALVRDLAILIIFRLAFAPFVSDNHVGEAFRGGLLDCKTLRWVEHVQGVQYDEKIYAEKRMNQYELVKPLLCHHCNKLGDDAVFLDERQDLCRHGAIDLVLLFKSSPKHFEQRQAIRHVWMSNKWTASLANKVRYAFILGQFGDIGDNERKHFRNLLKSCGSNKQCKNAADAEEIYQLRRKLFAKPPDQAFSHELLMAEALTYSDLLIVDSLEDSYSKLVYKTTAALQWFSRYCGHARFVALIDVDTFVFVDRLLQLLKPFEQTANFLGGNRMLGVPDRSALSKWYISYDQYPFEFWPDFLNGPVYIMGNDTAPKLLEASRNIDIARLGTNFEDVLFTGFARALVGIDEYHFCNLSIGNHPWALRRAEQITPHAVAFISNPRNTYHIQRTYLRNPFKRTLFSMPFY